MVAAIMAIAVSVVPIRANTHTDANGANLHAHALGVCWC
jgi:hypothetical protein